MKSTFHRGAAYLTIANIFFLGSSYVIQIFLGRYLGPQEYGILGVVVYILSLTEYFFGSGLFLATAKFIAERPNAIQSIVKVSQRMQVILAVFFASFFLFLAGPLARLFNEPEITNYIRILALIAPIYGLRSLYQSYLNGTKDFASQSISQIIGGIIKIVVVIGLVLFGFGIKGVLIGYFAGALASLINARTRLHLPKNTTETFPWKTLVSSTVVMVFYLVMFPVLFNIDLFLVKILLSNSELAGFYTAASTVARMPFYIFTSLSVVLLPTIATAISQNDETMIRYYIRQALRLGMIILIPIASIIALTAPTILKILYGSKYLPGATPMVYLAIGIAFMTLFKLTTTILIGGRRPNSIIWYVIGMVAIDGALNYLLIKQFGLVGAAIATGLVAFVGLIVTLVAVYAKHKSLLPARSFLSILVATIASVGISFLLPHSLMGAILTWAVIPTVFFGVLMVAGELRLTELLEIIKRKKAPTPTPATDELG